MFLVPKVPLVDQQRKVMEENTTLTVKGYTGAMGVDFWDRTAWLKEFNEADILVMTRRYQFR
jgi:endoribonuclease Dicer